MPATRESPRGLPAAAGEIGRLRKLVDGSLLGFLAPEACDIPPGLREAVTYSLSSGGKRIRPVVLLSAGSAVGGGEGDLLPFACAVEYVHTYSLIHDDLPAMDDDDYRRGRPTCHKAFGEAAAILAGDALLTEAFRIMAESPLSGRQPGRAIRAIALLARASGAEGMVGGQEQDIRATRTAETVGADPAGACGTASPGRERADEIAGRKTAALLAAAAGMGGILGGGTEAQIGRLDRYGRALGLLFQVTDDILDETGSFEEMGKKVAKDRARGKPTYPAVLGLQGAAARAESLAADALSAISGFGAEGEALREIVRLVRKRRT